MRLINETTQNQQIHFINGDVLNVKPGAETKEINESLLYTDEIVRVKSILKMKIQERTERKREEKEEKEVPKSTFGSPVNLDKGGK